MFVVDSGIAIHGLGIVLIFGASPLILAVGRRALWENDVSLG